MMKKLFYFLCFAFLLLSFQCENENTNTVDPNTLLVKKQEILNYIQTFTCNGTVSCNYIAFGTKPCGGPREYLVFPNTINIETLQNMVNEYNILDAQYNEQTGAVSDCMMVLPPNNIACENGDCVIIN
jgi:hypothetical protein